MDWRKHTTAEHYSLILGICQAEVWQAHGVWTAIVGREGSTMQQDHFSTLHDAQAWCEQRINGLHCSDPPLRDA